MKRNNFGLQWLCQKAKDIPCAFPGRGSEIPIRETHRCLQPPGEHSEGQLFTHMSQTSGPPSHSQLGSPFSQDPGAQQCLQGPANRQLTANLGCRFLVATSHAAWKQVAEYTSVIITRTSCCMLLFLYLLHIKIIRRSSLSRVRYIPEMQSDSYHMKLSPEPSMKTDKPFSLGLKFMSAPQHMVRMDPLLSAICFCWNWIQIRSKLKFSCLGLIYSLQNPGRQACLLLDAKDAI